MSKDFLSEVRRLKDGSRHSGTLESITVDVESSPSPDDASPDASDPHRFDPDGFGPDEPGTTESRLSQSDDETPLEEPSSFESAQSPEPLKPIESIDSTEQTAEADPQDEPEETAEAIANVTSNVTSTEDQPDQEAAPPETTRPRQNQLDQPKSEQSDSEKAGFEQAAAAQPDVDSDVDEVVVDTGPSEGVQLNSLGHNAVSNDAPGIATDIAPDETVAGEIVTDDDRQPLHIPVRATDVSSPPSSQAATPEDVWEGAAASQSEAPLLEITIASERIEDTPDEDSGDISEATTQDAASLNSFDAFNVASSDGSTEPRPQPVQPSDSTASSTESGTKLTTKPDTDAAAELQSLKTELNEALHHEERLEKRVEELDRMLKHKEKSLSQLQLELGQAQRSNALLSDELAEVKQYILKLTHPSDSSASTSSTSTPTADQGTANRQTTDPSKPGQSRHPSPSPHSVSQRSTPTTGHDNSRTTPQPSTSIQHSRSRYPRPLNRPAATPSPQAAGRSIGHLDGLPPMSTEQLTGSIPARRSPQPRPTSRVPARPQPLSPSRSVQSRFAQSQSQQPLHLPDRNASAAEDSSAQNKSSQSEPSEGKPSEDKTPSAQPSNSSIQRSQRPSLTRPGFSRPGFSRPGLSNLEEEVPMVARDTEKKEVKPKLSDSEIGWFD